MGNHLWTTSEVAKTLGVSEPTVYKLVRNGDLTPINKEKWHIEGSFYFEEEEVEKIRHLYTKPDLTTQDVAARIRKSVTTVLRFITEEKLPAYRRMYKGKTRYFIRESDLEDFMMKYEKKEDKRQVFYSKKTGHFLFQPFRQKDTDEMARIIEFNDLYYGRALTEQGKTYHTLYELKNDGFLPLYKLEHGKPNTKRGYASFQFPFPNQTQSTVFQLMDVIFKSAGPQNIKIRTTSELIHLQVKPTLLPLDRTEHMNEIDLLKNGVKEGKVLLRPNGVMIESDVEPLIVYLPSSVKEQIKRMAREEDKTMEELAKEFIRDGLDRKKKEQADNVGMSTLNWTNT